MLAREGDHAMYTGFCRWRRGRCSLHTLMVLRPRRWCRRPHSTVDGFTGGWSSGNGSGLLALGRVCCCIRVIRSNGVSPSIGV